MSFEHKNTRTHVADVISALHLETSKLVKEQKLTRKY
jgi:hypothetical protein